MLFSASRPVSEEIRGERRGQNKIDSLIFVAVEVRAYKGCGGAFKIIAHFFAVEARSGGAKNKAFEALFNICRVLFA
jgi:hypothetical protein